MSTQPKTSPVTRTRTSVGEASVPEPPGGLEFVAEVEGIEEYRLHNGLRVLLFPDQTVETITVNVTYLVGSRHEGYGESGMAHLLEHLVFKGTPKHPDIPGELTRHGCRPNGSTWFDRTNYFETFAASAENLVWAMELEADRMVNSFIRREDLDAEMTVVRNEFEMGENQPGRVLQQRVLSAAYLWHGYGRTTIGARSDIENVPISRLAAFYRRYYQPDNAVLAVSGRIDPERTLQIITETFGEILRPERELPTTYTEEPAQDGERRVTLRRVGDTQAVGIAYHVPSGYHPDFAAVSVLAAILGDSPSGRLYEELVKSGRIAAVSARTLRLRQPGVIYVDARLQLDSELEEATDAILAHVEGIAERPVEAREVSRAVAGMIRSWETTLRNSQDAAIYLSEWSALGDWRLMFLYRDALEQVSAADVNRVAAAYLTRANRTLGLYVPAKNSVRVKVPAAPEFNQLVANYRGKQGLDKGEIFAPSPAHIESRVERVQLPSGLRLVLLPKRTRGKTVNMAFSTRFGRSEDLCSRVAAAEMLGGMLMRGSRHRTREELFDALDRTRASMRLDGVAVGAFAQAEMTRPHVSEVLAIFAEMIQEPALAPEEFQALRTREVYALDESRRAPRQLAGTHWLRHTRPWPRGDARHFRLVEEELEDLDVLKLDDLRSFHQRFYGVSNAELALVGDFDPEEVKSQLGDLFGDWASPAPYERLASPFAPVAPTRIITETPHKEGAMMQAGMPIDLSDGHPDHVAVAIGSYLTGGGFLSSRLARRLRQKDGLCYGAGASYAASSFENDAWFTAYAIFAPQNRDAVERGLRETLEEVLDGGFEADEFADGRGGWLQSRTVSRSVDRELAGLLRDRAWQGRTLEWDEQIEGEVATLEVSAVVEGLRRWLDPRDLVISHAGDFAASPRPAGV